MTKTQYLLLNGTSYSYSDLAKGKFKQSLNDYEKQVLDFCYQWFSGKLIFHIQTSGSTGKPKSIRVTRNQMISSALRTQKALNLQEDETALGCINIKYIGGMLMLVRCFELNMKAIVVQPTRNPLKLVRDDQQIDFVALVPMQIQKIIEDGMDYRLNAIRNIIVGGAPLSVYQEKMINKLQTNVFATFGMTETITHIALRRLSPQNENVFKVLEGIKIGLYGQDQLKVQLPKSKLEVLTNDVIEMIDEKHFIWLGRTDFIINSGGVKISVEKLEREIGEVFNQMHLGNRYIVYPEKDDTLGEKVCLLVEGRPLIEPLQKSLEIIMSKHLGKYETPRKVNYLYSFEDTETGKIKRKETINKFFEQQSIHL